MKWPVSRRPVPDRDLPLYDRFYLYASKANQVDPVFVWGTDFEADALLAFLKERNRSAPRLVTPAHALIRATAMAFAQFPKLNARVVGRNVHMLHEVAVRIAFFHRSSAEIDLLVVREEFLGSLDAVARNVGEQMLEAARGTRPRDRDLARLRRLPSFVARRVFRLFGLLDRHFVLPMMGRLDSTRLGCVTVNDLSFAGAPPLRGYKPSRFPNENDTFNLTLGAPEKRVVERDGQFRSVTVIPLFVRADHRVVDAYHLGKFAGHVRELLTNPERLV